jgi:hypothetical protein
MLGTIVSLICWVWVVQVAAALLMYARALCKGRRNASLTDLASAPAALARNCSA